VLALIEVEQALPRTAAGKDLGERRQAIIDSQIRNALRLVKDGKAAAQVARDLGTSQATYYSPSRDLFGTSGYAWHKFPLHVIREAVLVRLATKARKVPTWELPVSLTTLQAGEMPAEKPSNSCFRSDAGPSCIGGWSWRQPEWETTGVMKLIDDFAASYTVTSECRVGWHERAVRPGMRLSTTR